MQCVPVFILKPVGQLHLIIAHSTGHHKCIHHPQIYLHSAPLFPFSCCPPLTFTYHLEHRKEHKNEIQTEEQELGARDKTGEEQNKKPALCDHTDQMDDNSNHQSHSVKHIF